jgi:hypothetical protein
VLPFLLLLLLLLLLAATASPVRLIAAGWLTRTPRRWIVIALQHLLQFHVLVQVVVQGAAHVVAVVVFIITFIIQGACLQLATGWLVTPRQRLLAWVFTLITLAGACRVLVALV